MPVTAKKASPLAPLELRLDLSPVEPARFGLRHAIGVDLDLLMRLYDLDGNIVDPLAWNVQMVLLPRSDDRSVSYNMVSDSKVLAVSVPGWFLTDRNGYTVELYARSVAADGALKPVTMIGRGEIAIEGVAYRRLLQATYADEPGPEPPVPEVIASWASFTDGAAVVVEPAWQQLTFDNCLGNAAELVAPDVRSLISGDAIIEVRVEVLHNWGSSVIFGWAVDGGPVEELGRVVVESNEFVPVMARWRRLVTAGSVISAYISSDFEFAQFAWQNGQAMLALSKEE